MPVYSSSYKPFIQGVSQQTAQQRGDGQLAEQINMLSDPVTGLRRRTGVKYVGTLPLEKDTSFVRVIRLNGIIYILTINTPVGILTIRPLTDLTQVVMTRTNSYYVASTNKAFKITVSQDRLYILNTERIPTTTSSPTQRLEPKHHGYLSVRAGAFSKAYSVSVKFGDFTGVYTVSTDNDNAARSSPDFVASGLLAAMFADAQFNNLFWTEKTGNVIAIHARAGMGESQLTIDSTAGETYMVTSGASRLAARNDLLGMLPSTMDRYVMAIGATGNSVYYTYNYTTKTWRETNCYEPDLTFNDVPRCIYMTKAAFVEQALPLTQRKAGDEDNNPTPKFINFGLTGISAYQSRLVLLSGSYIYLSRTKDFGMYNRTTMTELLDDDAIEIGHASMTSAQFEYGVSFNKDLILFAQDQQAVIPANATVLTPKTAVIYPITRADVSLACEPQVVARSLYYTYQRGVDYYQVGEMFPNSYSDAQYNTQTITSHIPLYARNICTNMAASATNNMVVFTANTQEVLVNQFLWQGEERPVMAFHKWVFPYAVTYSAFVDEYLLMTFNTAAGLVVGTMNLQLNQLDDKPVPYLDLYSYAHVFNGQYTLDYEQVNLWANIATIFGTSTLDYQPSGLVNLAYYGTSPMRHKQVMYTPTQGKYGTTVYPKGCIVVGRTYESTIGITPPFVKDQNGLVIAGTGKTLIQGLTLTLKGSGAFSATIEDGNGVAYSSTKVTPQLWSDTNLSSNWINTVSPVHIPCRTQLNSMVATFKCSTTYEWNLVSSEYNIRFAHKRKTI